MSSQHRDAILTAAAETFARFGFKKASIDDIARRAGIGKGTVYLHFESKEELFGAVVLRVAVNAIAGLEAVVKEARTPQAKVRAFLEARTALMARTAADLRVSEEALLELLSQAEAHRREPRAREAAVLEGVIKEGNAKGVFAVRSPRLVAAGISACLEGLDRLVVGPRGPEVQEALGELYEVIARGLLSPGRQGRATE
jgi:AcrR family transcriptional regulator